MKRFIVAAVAAAALIAPAGASANAEVGIDLDAVKMSCPTPVMWCVQDQIDYAFATAQSGINTTRYYANRAIYLVSQPPPVNQICYVIWGQPCSTALVV
jgi:opacity protein-like surface antigen